MQVSRVKVHVYVEGRELDSYVYGRIAETVIVGWFGFRVTRADELRGNPSGGKNNLIRLFKSLRRRGKLVMDFKGQRSASIFFVDKDVDDKLRRLRRSPHLVYTSAYDLEGEVFRAGDLRDALAAVLSISPNRVGMEFGMDDWRDVALVGWRPWAEYCLAARSAGLQIANYKAPSQLHDGNCRAMDPVKSASFFAAFSGACQPLGLNPVDLLDKAKRSVAADYRTTGGYGVFKGKWFSDVIRELAGASFPTETGRAAAGFRQRLASAMAQTVDATATWSARHRAALETAMTLV